MTTNDESERLRKALARYITVLAKSAAETHQAEDRKSYQSHLAEAALMFVAIEDGQSLDKLKQLVNSERHGFGWAYLRGEPGNAAESAFNSFATLVESA